MEEKKRRNTWVDMAALVIAILLGQVVCERFAIENEMVRFLVSAIAAGILLVLFYLLRYWLYDRY